MLEEAECQLKSLPSLYTVHFVFQHFAQRVRAVNAK